MCAYTYISDRIEDLENDWLAAEPFIYTPMQSYDWIKACSEAFVDQNRLKVMVLKSGTDILALAPLCPSHEYNHVFEQVGVELLHEPIDLIYKDEASLYTLLKELTRTGSVYYFRRVPCESQICTQAKRLIGSRKLVFSRPRVSYPYIELHGEDLSECIPRRQYNDMRRKQKKAEAQGDVTFSIHAPRDGREFLPLFERALQVEACSWKGRQETALKFDPLRRKFYESYGIRASLAGIMRICFMMINDMPVAMQLAVVLKNRLWLLKIGYDDNFSACSPGGVLMTHTLNYAHQNGLSSCEFLGSVSAWSRRWTDCGRESCALWLYPMNPLGIYVLANHLVRSLRKRLKHNFQVTTHATSPGSTAAKVC